MRATQSFIRAVRAAGSGDAAPIRLTERDLDGILRVGADFAKGLPLGRSLLSGLRLDAAIAEGEAILRAAAPVPWPGSDRWLNAEARAQAFEDGLTLSALRLGPIALPPAPVIAAGRVLANLILGDGQGDAMLASIERLSVEPDAVVLSLRLDVSAHSSMIRGVFARLGDTLPKPAAINRVYARLLAAKKAADLPWRSDLTPYLRFALTAAIEAAPDETLEQGYATAIFALAKACSPSGYAMMLSHLTGDSPEELAANRGKCAGVTLAGREDSRQHFVISAALRAASNRGVSVRIGEYKELYDSLPGGSGFDFSDIAANRAGIRLSDLMMTADAAAWPDLIARIGGEDAFMPPLDDLPPRLSTAEFTRVYGDVESKAYRALIEAIDARIDSLPLYR